MSAIIISTLLCVLTYITIKKQSSYTKLVEAYGCHGNTCGNVRVVDSPDKAAAVGQIIEIYQKIKSVYDAMKTRPGFVDRGPLQLSDILESDGFATADDRTTYLYDKKAMHICLRNDDGRLYASSGHKLNHIMYVVLHELTHKLTKSWEHTPEFWANFALVLKEAERQRSYTPGNFAEDSWVHCGKKLVNHGGY